MSVFEVYNDVGTVTVSGKSYSKGSYVPIPYIIASSYKVKREKLWSSDTGRSLSGAYKGTLIGIFPTVSFTIGSVKTNYQDVQAVTKLFDQTQAKCKFWDDKAAGYKTATFYFDSTEIIHKYISDKASKNRYDQISITCVPIDKEK